MIPYISSYLTKLGVLLTPNAGDHLVSPLDPEQRALNQTYVVTRHVPWRDIDAPSKMADFCDLEISKLQIGRLPDLPQFR